MSTLRRFRVSNKEDLVVGNAINDLKAEIRKGAALVVVGAGVSAGATGAAVATWLGLLKNGVSRCSQVLTGLPEGWSDRTLSQIESGDLTDMVLAAQNIAGRLGEPKGGEYRKWLRETVGTLSIQDSSTVDALQALNLPIATTNYDGVLSELTGRPPVTWRTAAAAQRWIRNDDTSILHLHGHWQTPESVVLGIRSYDEIIRDEPTQTLLRSCLYCRTLIFVGYGRGLHDPNFSALLEWSRSVLAESEYWHYRLVVDKHVTEVQAQHTHDRVRVVGIGASYDELPIFIRGLGSAPLIVAKAVLPEEAKLQELIEGRADLHRRRELLLQRKDTIPVADYITQLFEIAEAMASLQGRKSAIMMFHHAYSTAATGLDPSLRSRMGLRLCRWLLDDGQFEFARRLLAGFYEDEVLPKLSTSERAEVLRLSGECLFSLFHETDCIASYCEAVDTETDPARREEILNELLEASILIGDRVATEGLIDKYQTLMTSKRSTVDVAAIKARCLLRSGRTNEATELMRATKVSTDGLSEYQQGKLDLVTAEILHLDGQDEVALLIAQSILSTREADCPIEWSAVVRRNIVAIGLALWKPDATKEFYDLVDEQRVARVSLRDTEAVLDAKESAESGKHYDTLPDLWLEVRRTYRQAAWPIWRWALRNMSRECLQVGHIVPAFRFAILALDDEACCSAATALVVRMDRGQITVALDWLLANANPLRMSAVACLAIGVLADALTKSQIDQAFEWLFSRCDCDPNTRVHEDTCRRAWKAMAQVAIQLDASAADRLCQAATKHRFWTSFDVDRGALRTSVGNCLSTSTQITKNMVAADLARAVTADDSKTFDDRIKTINLLAYACRLCDEQTKKNVETSVYPKGAKLTSEMVLIAPTIVTRNLFSEGIDQWVQRITEELKLEVQHLQPGEEPTPISGSMMQYTKNKPDGGRHVVHIRSEVPVTAALSRRADMSAAVFDELLLAIEQGIANPDNLLTNRIASVQLLSDAAPHLNKAQAVRIAGILLPLAAGKIRSYIEEMSEEEAEHPLNRYSVKGGTVSDLQAVSLTALAEIEKSQATGLHRRIGNLIIAGFSSKARRVRCFAFRAWAVHPKLASEARLQVLFAVSEPDKQIVAEALSAIIETEQSGFSKKEWRAFVRRCGLIARSPDRDLRRWVANCLSRVQATLDGATKKETEILLQQLREDVCYSVRSAATASSHSPSS